MKTTKILRRGLYLSFAVLLASVVTMLWPLMATTRFWLAAGFAFGIVGTFFFTVALSGTGITKPLNEEE